MGKHPPQYGIHIAGRLVSGFVRSHSGYLPTNIPSCSASAPAACILWATMPWLWLGHCKKSGGDLNETIAQSGWLNVGINGAFRLLDNGQNQHSLDIVEVQPGG